MNRVKSMPKDAGMKNMLKDGGKMIWQDPIQVQDGGRQQTIRHFGNQKDQQVDLISTLLSRNTSNMIDGDRSG